MLCRISTEVTHLRKASHENILRIHGLAQWQEHVAIVTEYLPNENLKKLMLNEDVEMGPFLQLRMGFEIANGLAFIHNLRSDERLVHGDLKAENVLLTDDLHCKIADFGSSVLSNHTRNSSVVKGDRCFSNKFTECYAAPELLINPLMKLRTSHDAYSFAMIIFLILTRKIPVTNNSLLSVFLHSIKEGKRPPIDINELISNFKSCKVSVGLLQLLFDVLNRCWAQDPSERPKMTTVRDELHDQLIEIEPSQIYSQVALATSNMTVAKLSKKECKCVPVNQLLIQLSHVILSGTFL